MEYKSEQLAKKVLDEKRSGEHDFSPRRTTQNLGMICGGAVNVYFSYIPAGTHVLSVAERGRARFAEGEDLWLLSEISEGGKLGLWSAAEGISASRARTGRGRSCPATPRREKAGRRDFYAEQINSSGKGLCLWLRPRGAGAGAGARARGLPLRRPGRQTGVCK